MKQPEGKAQREKMHLGSDIVHELEQLLTRGVKIVKNENCIRMDGRHFRVDWVIEISMKPCDVYADRPRYDWLRSAGRVCNWLGMPYGSRLGEHFLYKKQSAASLDMRKLGEIISRYPSIGCPIETDNAIFMRFAANIDGKNPVRERVLVYTVQPSYA